MSANYNQVKRGVSNLLRERKTERNPISDHSLKQLLRQSLTHGFIYCGIGEA